MKLRTEVQQGKVLGEAAAWRGRVSWGAPRKEPALGAPVEEALATMRSASPGVPSGAQPHPADIFQELRKKAEPGGDGG